MAEAPNGLLDGGLAQGSNAQAKKMTTPCEKPSPADRAASAESRFTGDSVSRAIAPGAATATSVIDGKSRPFTFDGCYPAAPGFRYLRGLLRLLESKRRAS